MGATHSAQEAYRRIVAKERLTLPVGSEVERLFYEDFGYDIDAKVIVTPTAVEYDPSWFIISSEKRISTRPASSYDLRRVSSLRPTTADSKKKRRSISTQELKRPRTSHEERRPPMDGSVLTQESNRPRSSQEERRPRMDESTLELKPDLERRHISELRAKSPRRCPLIISDQQPSLSPSIPQADKWAPVIPSNKPRPTYSLFPGPNIERPRSPRFLSPESALRRTASDPTKRQSLEGDERWKERLRRRVADREANDEEKKRLSILSMVSVQEGVQGGASLEEEE